MNKSHTARCWGTRWVGGAGGMTTQDKDGMSQERPCVFDSHSPPPPPPIPFFQKKMELETAAYEKTLRACVWVCVCGWVCVWLGDQGGNENK